MIKVAIDNPVESLSIHGAQDFTSINVLRYSYQNVAELVRLGDAVISRLERTIRFFPESHYWSSGRTISAKSWVDGICLALDLNKAFRCLASDIKLRISVEKTSFVVTCDLEIDQLLSFLSSPIFSPYSSTGDFSGKYSIRNTPDGWLASPNPYSTNAKLESILYRVVESPYEAVELFNTGEIDKTPESCFPLELWDMDSPYLQSRGSDLVGYISFSERFTSVSSAELIDTIFFAISSIKFPNIFQNRWLPIKYNESIKYIHSIGPSNDSPVIVAYDKVYPNGEFCLAILDILMEAGINARVEEIIYGKESNNWDVRFHIAHFFDLPEKFRNKFCKFSRASFSYVAVGDTLLAKRMRDDVTSFPVCQIPLRFLQRFKGGQHG